MKTPLVNLGIPIGPGAELAPSSSKTSKGTFISFPLELSARLIGNENLDTNAEAGASLNASDPGGGTKGKNTSATSSRFPFIPITHVPAMGVRNSDQVPPVVGPPAVLAQFAPEPGPSQLAVSSSSAQVVSQKAIPSENRVASEVMAAEPQVLAEVDEKQVPSSAGMDASAARVENESASPQMQREENPGAVALPPVRPTEQDGQSQPLTTPGPSSPSAQPNLTGRTQPQLAYHQFADAAAGNSWEPENAESGASPLAVASSSAQEVSQKAIPSENRVDSEELAEPQLLADVDEKQVPSFTGILAYHGESSVGQAQSANAEKAGYGAGQNQNESISLPPQASGAQVTPSGAGFSRQATIPEVNRPNTVLFHAPASDASGDLNHAGSRPGSKDGAPGAGDIAPPSVDGSQTGEGDNSAWAQTSQDAQESSATDREPVPIKTPSFTSAGQKVSPPNPDIDSQIAADPSQAMRRSPDAQNGPTPPSTDSTGHATPAFQNWDGVRENLDQWVSSARLAEVVGRSELQVDMKSDSWGPVSVHATLSNGQVGAEIQVNDRDAHTALTEGLQALEKTLGDKGIQVVNLDISRGLGYNHDQSQGQPESQAGQPQHAARGYAARSAVRTETPMVSTVANRTDDFVLRRISVRV